MLQSSVIQNSTGNLKVPSTIQRRKKKSARHALLLKHLHRNYGRLLLILFSGLASSIASFLLTLLIGDYFMLRFDTESSKARLLHLLGIQPNQAADFFLLFGFLLLIRFVSGYYAQLGAMKQSETWVRNIREQLFAIQIRSQPEQFGEKKHEQYLLRYSNDMKAIQSYLASGILGGIRHLVFLAAGLSVMLLVHTGLALFIGGCFLATAILISWLAARQKKWIRDSRNQRSSLLAFAARSFRRYETIRRDEKQEGIISRFNRRSAFLYTANIKNQEQEAWIQSLAKLLPFLSLGFLLYIIGSGAVTIQPSDGIVVILLLMQMQSSLRSVLRVPGILNKGRISLDKIHELMPG